MKNASLLIHPEELSYKWINRLAESKIPTLAIHPVGSLKANESLENLISLLDEKTFREKIDYAKSKGLKIEYELHAARYLLPADLFQDHPEWFRMNAEGERTPDLNFCPSNSDALEYLSESAARLIKKLYGTTSRYFLWLDDAKDSACHCSKCKGLSPSDQQMIAMNKIIKRLKKEDRKAELAYLAYMSTIDPPKTIKPHKDIFLEYAPIDREFDKPISASAQSDPISKLLSLFGMEKAKVLDYWYDNSLFSNWKKPPKKFNLNKEVLRADIDYYRSLGFEDISSFACFLGEDYEELFGDVDISDFGTLLFGRN